MEISSFRDTWQALGTKGQLTLVGSLLLVLATMAVLFNYASRTSYTTLLSDLEPSESAEVTQALEGAGIGYKLEGGGTGVAVPEGDAAAARVALAEQGLPNDGRVGFELFDETSLGATEFQLEVDYERALEGEVARTIEGIEGVRRADVQLVLPEERLFSDEEQKPTAAVLLDADDTLDAATVRGIAHLVSSSVKGLDPAEVTVADQTGSLLWPEGQAGGTGASARMQAEQRYAAQISAQVNSMLVGTLGENKAQARVRVDLSLDETTIDKVTYAKTGTPLETSKDEETLQSSGGTAGTGKSTVPTYGGSASGSGTSKYSKTADRTSFGVDRTVEHTEVTPGKVERIDVALLVDSSVPEESVTALSASVASLAGVQKDRGDTLAVSRVEFAKAEETDAQAAAASGSMITTVLGLAKPIGLGLGIAIFLFFMQRTLRRRESDSVLEPTWLREIEQTVPLQALERGTPARSLPAHDPAGEQREALRGEVESIARTQPEQIASQMSTWMKE